MNPAHALFLAVLLAVSPPAFAVTEVPPAPGNKGNWNREEVIDFLEKRWAEDDLGTLGQWFNSEDAYAWRPIWVKGVFWRHPDTDPFKRKVAIMMLKGSSVAWGDPDPDGLPSDDPQNPAERPATIQGCLEAIHAAAPDLKVDPAELSTREGRIALAAKFATSVGLEDMLKPHRESEDAAANGDPDAPATRGAAPDVAKKATLLHAKFHSIPRIWLLAGAGAMLGTWYAFMKSRPKRSAAQ
jgi:hypothetical protein